MNHNFVKPRQRKKSKYIKFQAYSFILSLLIFTDLLYVQDYLKIKFEK